MSECTPTVRWSEPVDAHRPGGTWMTRLVAKITAAVAAAAVAAAAVGAGLALDGAGVWAASRAEIVVLVVAAGLLASGSTSISAVSEFRSRRLGAAQTLVEVTLTGTAWAIVDAAGIDFRDLGLAAYRVERIWWQPWQQRLRRVHRIRARFRPAASGIDWAPGKGVIGACVVQGQVVAQDIRAIYDAIGECTEEEWNYVVPAEARQGLSYREYLAVADKYDIVVATPILDDSGATTSTVGCVALDGPADTLDRLSADDVLGLLDSAAQSLLRQSR